ncbi:MAG: ParB N-terminal domain-containing protein [Candidatus Sulfotelmatobacter sp.]
MSLRINPELQAVVAPLTTEEYAQLRDNIQRDGLLEPITLWAEESGTIVDGHNRHAICQELGIGFKTKAISLPNIEAVKLWILEHQVGRRNLTDDQRAIIWNDIREQRAAVSRAAAVVKARNAKAGTVDDNVSPTKPRTLTAVVAESKIPERMLRKAQKLKKTNPDLYERVRSGTVTLREASKPKKNEKKFAEKDYFARIGRGLAASFSGVDPRLKELIAIKKSEWTPQADEGIRCLLHNLTEVSDKADAYANQLRAVLEKNA